jgi:nucleotide-binding universal stress UspA family protein
MKIQRILVPVDYSPCSRVSLRAAAALAKSLDASLDIVHVWDRPSYVSDVVMTTSDPLSSKSLIAMIQQNAQRDLDEFLRSAEGGSNTPLTGRLLSGDPASALLHELKQGTAALVCRTCCSAAWPRSWCGSRRFRC